MVMSIPSGGEGSSIESEYTIGDLADEFNLTLRTLRFYEDKGLLRPRRKGLQRLYSRRDKARLKLIVMGKKVGFSLQEIVHRLSTSVGYVCGFELDALGSSESGHCGSTCFDDRGPAQRRGRYPLRRPRRSPGAPNIFRESGSCRQSVESHPWSSPLRWGCRAQEKSQWLADISAQCTPCRPQSWKSNKFPIPCGESIGRYSPRNCPGCR